MLRRVFEQGAYAEKALLGEAGELDPRDRALAMRLSYGAVQRRGTTDHLIAVLTGRPPPSSTRRCWPHCGGAL